MNIQEQILAKIKEANNIVITSHKSPDGDSIGSSMALFQFCKKLNKNVTVCHPDPAPKFLLWLEDTNLILNYEQHKIDVENALSKADLIFSLDYNESSRMGKEMSVFFDTISIYKIMIDHHTNPSDFADINWTDTSSCSTCQLIFDLIQLSGSINVLNEEIGTAIYLGLMTDTGSFRYNSVLPKTHLIAAKLLEIGVKHDQIHEKVFDVNTPEKLILRGYASSEKLVILPNLPVAYISLSNEDFARFKHEKGDSEGLVNIALSIEGVKIAAFFSENENEIKISFRSKGDENPVNLLARDHFSGGGHANAAGGISYEDLKTTIQKFIHLVPNYV